MPAPFPDVKSIFLAALEKTNPTERALFLEEACGTNATLSKEVHDLLAAHAVAQGYLAAAEVTGAFTPAEEGTAAMPQPSGKDPLLGTKIDRYKLLQRLGEGGMGIVYLAEQTEPVQRKVAMKIIRAGMDSDQVLARFEAERQALALMDHPNIARVLDGGTTTNHRPYFVMELVKGIPLTKYCDEQHLTPQQRLELFIPVCQAVQHAHQKGVIHRDLKPSNILIALYDGKPVPKVIDFGVAKALHHRLTESTMFTEVGSVIGTLEYMSPEQAELNNLDIDTRSDIYSLGVILYELLTGERPLDSKRLRNAAFTEMLRIIREEEPSKPSTKLSQSEKLASISAQRKMEPVRLSRLMQGDLDWIVMKALAKERDRRYETANGFAMDIQRYLSDEPVSAGPPTARYRLRKFVQRNRGQVIAASLVLLALIAGIAGTSWQAIRAERARADEATQRELAEAKEREAKDERGKAVAAAVREEEKRKEAETNLAYARKGNDILASVFAGLDPKANYATVAELRTALKANLQKAVKELEGSAIGNPLEVAAMQNTLGLSLLGLGEYEQAITLFTRARETRTARLRADHLDTLTSMNNLALGYLDAGKRDLALPLFEETFKRMKATLGADHQATLKSMSNLALGYRDAGKPDLALPLFEETFKLTKAKLGTDHLDTLASMSGLAEGYRDAGKPDLALPFLEETFKLSKAQLGADHPLTSMNNLAMGYQAVGKLDRALPLYEDTVKRMKATLGANHPFTLTSMNNLANGYQAVGKLDLALPLYEETFKLSKATLGADHPQTLRSMGNLAACYWSMKRLDNSVPLFVSLLPLQEKKLGRQHPNTQLTVANLGVNYKDAGKLDLALPLLEEAFHSSRHIPKLRWVGVQLLNAYVRNGKRSETIELMGELLSDTRKTMPEDSPQLALILAENALMLLELKAFADAEPLLRECLAIREKTQPDAWNTFNAQSLLGAALLGQKKYTEAEPLLLKGYDGMNARAKTIPKEGNTRLPEALDRLIQLYTETNKPDEVKKWQAEKDRISKTLEKK